MFANKSRWRLPVLLVSFAALCTGCNLLSLPYFLLPFADYKNVPPALMKLESDDKDKEVKVVIISHAPNVEMREEFVRIDRELCTLLTRQLEDYYKQNEKKVTIVSPRKIDKYKDEHMRWYDTIEDVGTHFEADYVIYLELHHISLIQPGSINTLLRGQVNLDVSVVDMSKLDDNPRTMPFTCAYPSSPRPLENRNELYVFKQGFLNNVAKRLSWYFLPHPPSEDFGHD